MPSITDAATLLIELKKSGTGEGKLDLIRDLLKTNPDATAEDAINVLANSPNITQRTLEKAMQLAEHGEVLVVQEVKTLSLEEQILQRRKQAVAENQKKAVLDKLAADKLAAESQSKTPSGLAGFDACVPASPGDEPPLEDEPEPPDNPAPPPVQIGAAKPENIANKSAAVGPGKVETIREAPAPATAVKNPSKKS